MNPQRPSRTFADYAAIAVCPVLIMLAVGCVVSFLVEVGYAGSQAGRLRWTLFWFVLAMVLVSRIAIEKGYEYAGVYGVGLAAATAVVLLQYVGNYPVVWCLLGLIWWATNKLTWDCTVIDDDQDASGEGLLQSTRLEPWDVPPAQDVIAAEPSGSLPSMPEREPLAQTKPSKGRWWKAMFGKRTAASNQPHAPGFWVIYFSLGALLVFGLGQGLIPAQDVARRRYGFALLCVYLAAALGLLLLTSFLGLRRYLRQRRLAMPPAMSATWLTMGSMVASAILAGCILLPRPDADWSLTAMINRIGDRPRPPSKEGSTWSQPQERPAARNQSGANERGAKGEDRAARGEGQAATGEQSKSAEGKRNPPAAGTPEQAKPQPAPTPPVSPRLSLHMLRTALYAALVLLILYVSWKNKDRLLVVIRAFWQGLREFWSNMFASRQAAAPQPEPGVPAVPVHPFAAFSNPFASGEAGRMSVQELIVYSFNGLEAWATERQCGRHPDQTPFEFCEGLGKQVPELAFEVRQVTRLYVQVAFAKASSLTGCEPVLEALWNKLDSARSGLDWFAL